ncbi:MAG TPA: glycine--tRNA ligase subunit beta [Terriglobales bacterium]|nr:glycine--tRNA ligase subunit beta [Terriglobales bacterium]
MSRDLLFEIGVEELPASYVPPALEQLERGIRVGLDELRLAHGEAHTRATPRRLALAVEGVADRQGDFDEEAMGPAARAAYDAAGNPTKALLGFCQSKGADPASVRRVETPRGEYVAVTVHHEGKPAADVLPVMLARVATSLAFPKVMRWLDDETRFARPVRWLVALLGGEVLPVRAFGLEAGRESRGHRFLAPGPVPLARAGDYLHALEKAYVLANHLARRERIRAQIEKMAHDLGGEVRPDEELLDINNFLVEWPTAFAGSYDPRFHDLPNEVIITALREHQSFFTVRAPGTGDEKLLDKFIAVRNGDERGLDTIRKGNEGVLAARLEDAEFYWQTDLKRPPASRVGDLKSVVWMEGLGSLREKADRLVKLGGWIAGCLAPGERSTVERGALLCKTDLLSEMIGSGKEYASLQGIIGGWYATHSGEPQAVGDAIYWHYHPRGAGDELPKTAAGAILSIADKLDHVVGAFIAGKPPSGSQDPYGVRRAANGVVRILVEKELHLDLGGAIGQSLAPFTSGLDAARRNEIRAALDAFWRDRVRSALEERGVRYDSCEAALEARLDGDRPGWTDPADGLARAQVIDRFRGDERFEPLAILFRRVANIVEKATERLPGRVDRARLVEPMEKELADALESARERTRPLWAARDYDAILPALLEMEQTIHAFFDAVLVNAEDLPTRLNRLQLVSDVRALFVRGWDLSKVVVEGEKGQ